MGNTFICSCVCFLLVNIIWLDMGEELFDMTHRKEFQKRVHKTNNENVYFLLNLTQDCPIKLFNKYHFLHPKIFKYLKTSNQIRNWGRKKIEK